MSLLHHFATIFEKLHLLTFWKRFLELAEKGLGFEVVYISL